MYANYNRPNTITAIALSAQGIDSPERLCADLLDAPASYYQSKGENWRTNFFRVKFADNTNTIYSNPDTDPQLKSALAHRIVMEDICDLIDDLDKKHMSFVCNAIVRGDLEMLVQVFAVICETMPHKLRPYLNTLGETLSGLGSGVCLAVEGPNMILVHLYHGNCAIAIDPATKTVAVLPIFTDWDGTVFVAEGEVISPGTQDLMEKIQDQCVRRILLRYEQSGRRTESEEALPVIHELAA